MQRHGKNLRRQICARRLYTAVLPLHSHRRCMPSNDWHLPRDPHPENRIDAGSMPNLDSSQLFSRPRPENLSLPQPPRKKQRARSEHSATPELKADQRLTRLLVAATADPFALLGPHPVREGWSIRFFIPWAAEASIAIVSPNTPAANSATPQTSVASPRRLTTLRLRTP